MFFTDDSLFPENQSPLIITAAPYGPEWLPGDADIAAVVGRTSSSAPSTATSRRDDAARPRARSENRQGSTNFDEYNYMIGRLKEAVPKMILQVGGSISFAPHT